jgi:hypothetical protein
MCAGQFQSICPHGTTALLQGLRSEDTCSHCSDALLTLVGGNAAQRSSADVPQIAQIVGGLATVVQSFRQDPTADEHQNAAHACCTVAAAAVSNYQQLASSDELVRLVQHTLHILQATHSLRLASAFMDLIFAIDEQPEQQRRPELGPHIFITCLPALLQVVACRVDTRDMLDLDSDEFERLRSAEVAEVISRAEEVQGLRYFILKPLTTLHQDA